MITYNGDELKTESIYMTSELRSGFILDIFYKTELLDSLVVINWQYWNGSLIFFVTYLGESKQMEYSFSSLMDLKMRDK